MCQWSRTSRSSRAASARPSVRLVIPWTFSTVVLPFSVRSRVSSNACASPGHFGCSVRTVVVRSVRFSRRPCPLSTVVATRFAGSGGAAPSGGKSRGDRPGPGLVAEGGADIDHQAGLVVLGDEHVVPAAGDDLLAHLALAEDRVPHDHPAR